MFEQHLAREPVTRSGWFADDQFTSFRKRSMYFVDILMSLPYPAFLDGVDVHLIERQAGQVLHRGGF